VTDTLLTLLNVGCGVLLTAISILMGQHPPAGDDRKKGRGYWVLFFVLGVTVIVTTVLQSSRTASEKTADQKQHGIDEGKLEGKLDLMSGVLKKSNCASTADIGTVVQQELAKVRYERARTSIGEGNLASLSSDRLVNLVPGVTQYMRNFREGWYGESYKWELYKKQDLEYETWNKEFKEKEKEHTTTRWPVLRTQQEWAEEEQRTNASYHTQLAQLLSDAETLRGILRSKLPKDAQTPDDDAAVALFAKAMAEGSAVPSGLNCCPASIDKAADYLDSLATRVSRIKTLQN